MVVIGILVLITVMYNYIFASFKENAYIKIKFMFVKRGREYFSWNSQ